MIMTPIVISTHEIKQIILLIYILVLLIYKIFHYSQMIIIFPNTKKSFKEKI